MTKLGKQQRGHCFSIFVPACQIALRIQTKSRITKQSQRLRTVTSVSAPQIKWLSLIVVADVYLIVFWRLFALCLKKDHKSQCHKLQFCSILGNRMKKMAKDISLCCWPSCDFKYLSFTWCITSLILKLHLLCKKKFMNWLSCSD